ncbi:hypothetical protein [Streptomyces radicis]|uniref:Uncharacterized protein n=1 Tax=Streptomyces radicis TaxID=1750517 RepID=A0A3A9WBM6_9ACTN|nr:hypothetical protein [Streptomyces radicis]RKN10062.1 hypothetical protein D7319_09785 [Streptomyces radicis]RKN24404.1 hypothetical protein D7318_10965 [Streptomyces radicis]
MNGEFRVTVADERRAGIGDAVEGAEEREEPAEPEKPGPPRGYRMTTPTDWFRIPLRDGEKRGKALRALLDITYPNRDEFALKRRELLDLMTSVTESSARRDGVELYVSTQAALGVPIPASLLVTAEPEDPAQPRQIPAVMVADGIRDAYGKDAEVSVVRLPSGNAVRCRRLETSDDSRELGVPKERPSTLLEFYLPVPHSTAWLLLTFSAPLIELADAQIQLFDAVASSFHWSR